MAKSGEIGEKWLKVVKSGESEEKWGKSKEKCLKVVKSGKYKKLRKVGKSGEKW